MSIYDDDHESQRESHLYRKILILGIVSILLFLSFDLGRKYERSHPSDRSIYIPELR